MAAAIAGFVGFLAGILGAVGAIVIFGILEHVPDEAVHSTLFSFAIIGLYLVAIVIAIATLVATLLGRPLIERTIKHFVSTEVDQRASELRAQINFIVGYILGELGSVRDKFYDDSYDFTKNAIQTLPPEHPSLLAAKNNLAFYLSQHPKPSNIHEMILYARELKSGYHVYENVEFAKTYAAAIERCVQNDAKSIDKKEVEEAVDLLEKALQARPLNARQRDAVKDYVNRLRRLLQPTCSSDQPGQSP